jgi:hypothetical protein
MCGGFAATHQFILKAPVALIRALGTLKEPLRSECPLGL